MRRKASGPPDSEGEESHRMPPPPPMWGNPKSRVQKQQVSFLAESAAKMRGTYHRVPVPRGFAIDAQTASYKLADSKQARLLQDAHASANGLMVLCDTMPLYRLQKAELTELERASVLPGLTVHGARPPRAVAITVIVDDTRLTNRNLLLDAAAYWARVGTSADTRCARSVRMALIASDDAVKYCARRSEFAKTTRYNRAHVAQVCVSWVIEPHEDNGNLTQRSEFAPIEYANTSFGYFERLRTTVAEVLSAHTLADEKGEHVASLPIVTQSTAPLFRTMDVDSETIDGAYEASVVETSDEFWKLIVQHTPERLSTPLGEEHKKFLCFAERKVFLKLVPRGMPQNHPEVYHGLLLYKQGMHDEMHEHCVESADTELKNPYLACSDPWGLRPPEDPAVDACCLHVLSLRAELVRMGDVVSAFGLLAAPGERLTVYENCSFPKIVSRLVPFDQQFASTTFALPMDAELINPADESTWLPLWAFTEDAIIAYLHLFEPVAEDEDEERPEHAKALPFQLTKHIAPPTQEDEMLRTMLGMSFGVSAFRIGDLYAEAERLNVCPNLSAFLMAAIGELGTDAPISRALADLTTLCTTHKEECSKLQKRVLSLASDADKAKEEAAAVAKKAKVKLEEASKTKADEAAKTEARAVAGFATIAQSMGCSVDKVNVMLKGVGVTPVDQVTLKKPIKGGRVVAIVRAYARASGHNVDDAYADWPKKNAVGEGWTAVDTVLRTIAHASTAAGGGRVVLLVQSKGEVFFHMTEIVDGEYVREALAPIQALGHAEAVWMHWSEDASALTPLVRA